LNGKSERAVELFKEGYNCSQAVLAAYCEDVGIDMKTALMIASPLERYRKTQRGLRSCLGHVYDCRIKVRVCGPEGHECKKGAL